MKWKVVISAPYMQPVISGFQKEFDERNIELIIPPVHERLGEIELLAWVNDADGVICGDDQFTKRVLQSATKLKVISKWGTGIDSIDLQTCRQLGISVRNTPNAFSEPVADSVMGYILCFARQLPWMDSEMRSGKWHKIPGRSLGECTLGVIGVGNVGKALVRRAKGFGMRILGNDIVEMPSDYLLETKIEMVSKERLLKKADFISLNCDLNPTSYHLMDELAFSKMKPEAVFINTSRGQAVDEQAMIKALEEQKISGAALDVFEIEPLPSTSPLLKMKNVITAPHNSNSSPQAWEKVHRNSIENLIEELVKGAE